MDAVGGAAACELTRRELGEPRPAVHRHIAVPGVDRHRDSVAEPGCGSGPELGVERRGADEHARRTGHERRVDRVEAAVATSDLHGQSQRCDAGDEAEIGLARERAVEVDEMEPRGALGHEALGRVDRVASLGRYRFAAALQEVDDAALEHVHCRIDREALAS